MAKVSKIKVAKEKDDEQKNDTSPLPLIPVLKKKASKSDTPLEKEIRRFNKLVKDLHDFEQEAEKQKQREELYERLYQQQVVPELAKLANARYRFVLQAQQVFGQDKFTKPLQKHFYNMVNSILGHVVEFIPEARDLAREYLNKMVSLFTKKEKENLKSAMNQTGFKVDDINQFDIGDMWEQRKDEFEKMFSEEHEKFFHEQKETHRQDKKAAHEHADINSLYKELAKLLHPDLEQDETIRHEKEQLMKELVQARNQRDLYGMLLIRAKAQQFLPEGSGAGNQSYTLEQLKRYNKELKAKLNEKKSDLAWSTMEDLWFGDEDEDEFFTGFSPGAPSRKHTNPEEEIKREVKDIKTQLREVEKDIKTLQTPADLRAYIEMHKQFMKEFF